MNSEAFWILRAAPLHEFGPEQWTAYYPAMARWLHHPDAEIRTCAVERLTMAALWAEWSNTPRAARVAVQAHERLQWLLQTLTDAHAVHDNVLPAFLRGLRYHGDREPFRSPLLTWLSDVEQSEEAAGIDRNLVTGASILVAGWEQDWNSQAPRWLALLDHASHWVRGCAAFMLGAGCDHDTDPTQVVLFDLISGKEIARPGIAGPFWSAQSDSGQDRGPIALWIMDLLERRQGPVPADLPFNDIAFHLHELCCEDAAMVARMMRGGHTGLALMTATEINGPVAGMQPLLEALAANADPAVARAASRHLDRHYKDTPPAA